ncbi:MAG TPA: hypothetical protein VK801_03750 [Caulobacteraceae bacterium]|nr:hypothetical protein [Caulobacteraceae bacterium]
MTRGLLELQQLTGVAEKHLAIIGQRDTAGRAPEKRTPSLELQPLDLLADGRLRQVEPFGCAVKSTAIGDGDEGAQQLEIKHAFDPIS